MRGLPPGWQSDIIKGLGGTHSAGAEHLLGAWQQWEGGGTANDATFNPLNTTIGSGYKKINSVGVSAFPDWQTGIQETVNTLKAYPALTQALRTGKIDFSNPALQADFNYWLSGKRTPGMTPYVAKIARSFGQDVPLSETKATSNTVYATPTAPVPPPMQAKASAPKPITLMDIALGKKSIMDMFFQKRPAVGSPRTSAVSPDTASPPPSAGAGQSGWTAMPTNSNWTKMDGSAAPASKGMYPGLAEAFYDPLGQYDSGRFSSQGIGGHSDHVHISQNDPKQMLRAIKVAQGLGLSVRENPYTDPVDPVHTEGSFHYQNFPGTYGGKKLGKGIDVSGPSEAMAKFYRLVTGT